MLAACSICFLKSISCFVHAKVWQCISSRLAKVRPKVAIIINSEDISLAPSEAPRSSQIVAGNWAINTLTKGALQDGTAWFEDLTPPLATSGIIGTNPYWHRGLAHWKGRPFEILNCNAPFKSVSGWSLSVWMVANHNGYDSNWGQLGLYCYAKDHLEIFSKTRKKIFLSSLYDSSSRIVFCCVRQINVPSIYLFIFI